MPSRIAALAVDAHDPRVLAEFWSAVLDWPVVDEENGDLSIGPAGAAGPTIDFFRVPESKSVKNRLHIDLRADGVDRVDELERLLALGAGRVGGLRPDPVRPAERAVGESDGLRCSASFPAQYCAMRTWPGCVTTCNGDPWPDLASAGRGQSSASTARSASSTSCISCVLSRPAKSPSRVSGSMTVSCSTITRVATPSISIAGRKDAARRPVEVGATIQVESGRSSDCTTTQ